MCYTVRGHAALHFHTIRSVLHIICYRQHFNLGIDQKAGGWCQVSYLRLKVVICWLIPPAARPARKRKKLL